MSKFDLAKTGALAGLFGAHREQRNDAWIQQFYATVPDATLMSFDPQVQQGPDLFPYFQMAIPDPGPVTPFCITHILDHVLENGFGIAIFGDSSRSKGPEWVLTYGDLLSYSLYGRFDGDPADSGRAGGNPATGGAHQILKAAPSESYFPTRARRAIGRYLRKMFQHPDPKIALVVDAHLNPPRNLMINLTLAQYRGDKGKLDSAMRYLLWFVPRTYSLMPMPPGWDDSGFVALE
jgi:hypothetical protein